MKSGENTELTKKTWRIILFLKKSKLYKILPYLCLRKHSYEAKPQLKKGVGKCELPKSGCPAGEWWEQQCEGHRQTFGTTGNGLWLEHNFLCDRLNWNLITIRKHFKRYTTACRDLFMLASFYLDSFFCCHSAFNLSSSKHTGLLVVPQMLQILPCLSVLSGIPSAQKPYQQRLGKMCPWE